jgi:hypothetical protein
MKFPAYLWKPEVHHFVHKCQNLDATLIPQNSVHVLIPYFFKTHVNAIFSYVPRSYELYISF